MDLIKRRQFLSASIALFATSAIAAPAVAWSRGGAKLPRIGVLLYAPAPQAVDGFLAALREAGYHDGRNVIVEVRDAGGSVKRLPLLATEFVRSGVDVIFTAGTASTRAAKAATATVPIVMMAGDPVRTGLVPSLSRSGSNLTGLSSTAADGAGKLLQMLRELLPNMSRIGLLIDPEDPFSGLLLDQTQAAASALDIALHTVHMRRLDNLESAFSGFLEPRVDALIVQTLLATPQVAAIAIKHRIVAVSDSRLFLGEGALIAFGANYRDLFRRAASYIDRILKGANPADLPIEQPTSYELMINLKTAKLLGITIPPALLLRADKVIE